MNIEELKTENAALHKEVERLNERMFPIMVSGTPGSPSQIPWRLLAPMAGWAQNNHSQSLEGLANRGGLSACEALAIIEGRRWRKMEDAGPRLKAIVDNDSTTTLRTQLTAAEARCTALAETLNLVLPMARGYAAAHPVGNNQQFIEQAKAVLNPDIP